MSLSIQKVAVLGAGVMGSGIAAQLANAGVPVLLLDMLAPKLPPEAPKAARNAIALGALQRLAKSSPPQLASRAAAELIETGNFEDDLEALSSCDWVIEAVKEDLGVKRSLFAHIEAVAGKQTIISSNTSGLSISAMLEGRSDDFKRHFLVTHFFNPVRYMKLLELVRGEDTLDEVVELVQRFGELRLGKGIVFGKDTTNFIANRIGVYAMMRTMRDMARFELNRPEEIDAIFGVPMGRPKSAVFRTADVVGLDTLLHVAQNCYDALSHDEEREIFDAPVFMRRMLDKGLLGEKSGSGFYAKKGKEILSLDLSSMEYGPRQQVSFESVHAVRKLQEPGARIATLLRGQDNAARLAESSTLATLAYAARRIPEISDDLVNIDRGMRWGFGWELGPFEIWDAIGVAWGVERMKSLGIEVPAWVEQMLATGRKRFYELEGAQLSQYQPIERTVGTVAENPRQLSVATLRRQAEPIHRNRSASLWDLGDGALLLELTSKMNAIDNDTVAMINQAIDIAERDFETLVIGNDTENFSAGANLMGLLGAASQGMWSEIETLLIGFQAVNQRLRYSSIPTVAAVAGRALGGGCELLMGANTVQAALESYVGLVELGVGVIPGGGGNLQLLRNLYGQHTQDNSFDPTPFVRKAFMTIAMAKVAGSAEEAKELGYFAPDTRVTMNRDFVISDAKSRGLDWARSYIAPRSRGLRLPGRSGKASIDAMLYDMQLNGVISEHDRLIGGKLATVLTGGDCSGTSLVSEERLLELEREAFLSLCGEPKTQARMKHMLETGKALRN